MQVISETELLEQITAFRSRHKDMAPTTFGRNATGNANLIKELEEGKSPSLRTVQKIAAFMKTADAALDLRAKLDAPPEPREEVEIALPFPPAPVNLTGASLPTCSPTIEASTSPRANGSCPSSSPEPAADGGRHQNSCSGADA